MKERLYGLTFEESFKLKVHWTHCFYEADISFVLIFHFTAGLSAREQASETKT